MCYSGPIRQVSGLKLEFEMKLNRYLGGVSYIYKQTILKYYHPSLSDGLVLLEIIRWGSSVQIYSNLFNIQQSRLWY